MNVDVICGKEVSVAVSMSLDWQNSSTMNQDLRFLYLAGGGNGSEVGLIVKACTTSSIVVNATQGKPITKDSHWYTVPLSLIIVIECLSFQLTDDP